MPSDNIYPNVGCLMNKRYEVIDVSGEGNTAIVLKCKDKVAKRDMAVKRFFPDKLTKEIKRKIADEPKLGIKSDQLVFAEQSFREKGFYHLVMSYIDGQCLGEILASGITIEPITAVNIALYMTKAVDDLHKINYVSTDIKPDNTMITPEGKTVLIDNTFCEKKGSKAQVSKGTVPYAPYELLNNERLHASTDTFSIVIVLCELLMEVSEFENISGSWELDIKRGLKPDISLINSKYPEIGRIADRALEPNPEGRFTSAYDLYKELYAYYNLLAGVSSLKPQLRLLFRNGKELCFNQGTAKIGRNMIDAYNFMISECHFELEYNGNGVGKIRDTNSRNGTSVNGTRVGDDWTQINDSDVIQVANIQLDVRISA